MIRWALGFLFLALISSASYSKQVLGQTEKVMLVNFKTILNAKIDTGAEQSSLSATDLTYFEKNHKKYVRFQVKSKEKTIFLTLPLVKFVHILKRKNEMNSNSQYESRPVTQLEICIGNNKRSIFVNLIDRSRFHYPMLIGAKDLKDMNVYVDVNQKFLTKPICK